MLNLITVVGENTHILPHMLKHYEDKIDKAYVCVYQQSKDDGILEEIEELGIEPFMVFTEPKYNWERVTEIYNTVKQTKPNDWWIVSDDDELQVYPEPIEDIIENCERKGYEFVTGGFLDRIGIDGTFPKVTRETDLHKAFPLAGFFRYPMSRACPNKVTLMKGYQNVTSGQHYASFNDGSNSWGTKHPKRMPIQEVFTQVHHFKWDSTCIERIKKVADNKKEYSYSGEYKIMYDSIKDYDWKIDVNNLKYLVEDMKEFSYIEYMDYPHWDILRDKIIKI
tara:strand:- start:5043 stop:5882 length:840 start_codon:yes stop_codon:yes gene_type:complete